MRLSVNKSFGATVELPAYLFYDISISRGHVLAQQLRLLKYCLGGFLLLVGWVAVLAQYALDHCAQVGADAFLHRAIYRRVPGHGLDEFPRNGFERFGTKRAKHSGTRPPTRSVGLPGQDRRDADGAKLRRVAAGAACCAPTAGAGETRRRRGAGLKARRYLR